MMLICPSCGGAFNAESGTNDALCRATLLAVAALPAPLPVAIIGYMALFRPMGGKKGLSWKKAKRLVTEVAALTAKGHVQVQGKPARPCPPRIWALAMEQMTERRDNLGLSLPLSSHIYLSKVAWDQAEKEDAQGEQLRREAELSGKRPGGGGPLGEIYLGDGGLMAKLDRLQQEKKGS